MMSAVPSPSCDWLTAILKSWTTSVIPAGGFLLVWADKDVSENTGGDLHANFNLSKGGEAIGLYAVSGTNIIQVDALIFGQQIDNVSIGRYPEGGNNFYSLSMTTPR